MNTKYKKIVENVFKDFLKRAKKQYDEVEVVKKKRKKEGEQLGGVKDFQKFDKDNKKLRASLNKGNK